MLASILFADERWLTPDSIYGLCEVSILSEIDAGRTSDLLQLAAILMRPSKIDESIYRVKSSSEGISLVALVRSKEADVKISLPPIHVIESLSPSLASTLSPVYVRSDQLPVFRGDYNVWERIFAHTADTSSMPDRRD